MFLGIDIGGTKTHLVVDGGNGGTREHVLETASWRQRRDRIADASNLIELILQLADGQPTSSVIGSHGCDTDADRLALQVLMAERLHGLVLVLNDSELLLPAAGRDQGISVIAGTGSIAVSRDPNANMLSAGGWGWFLGDEGSASGLVRDAARAVRHSIDQGKPLDVLGRLLVDALGVADPVEFGRAMTELGTAARIGGLAHLVFDAADRGSTIARDVIENGGDALALLVEQLISRGARGSDVVAAGGVVSRQRRLFEAFEVALSKRVPMAKPALLDTAPVVGAVLLAKELAKGVRRKTLPLPHTHGVLEQRNNGETE
ncbi:MAG: N-acetylglucosamine kinase [Rhizobiaceae bacterium]|nr:N-acetylglucosamine kinase [Rhizobiaceae bacterium]